MTASYSALLLEAWNPNLSAYSMSIPSGEVRIKPAPLPLALEACHLHLLVYLASLERCSCLCSESIPLVTEQSVMFV